jgi:hypothetical protein
MRKRWLIILGVLVGMAAPQRAWAQVNTKQVEALKAWMKQHHRIKQQALANMKISDSEMVVVILTKPQKWIAYQRMVLAGARKANAPQDVIDAMQYGIDASAKGANNIGDYKYTVNVLLELKDTQDKKTIAARLAAAAKKAPDEKNRTLLEEMLRNDVLNDTPSGVALPQGAVRCAICCYAGAEFGPLGCLAACGICHLF